MSLREASEGVIIGGGIAGNARAPVLARAGRGVLVLERSTVYRDRVRGELFQPWGVAEARRLGLDQVLMDAGGVHHTRFVPYDETVEPAEAAPAPLDKILPDVPGSLGVGHPPTCEALGAAAAAAGARVLRGVTAVDVDLGSAPTVRYALNGVEHTATCRVVIGADGRGELRLSDGTIGPYDGDGGAPVWSPDSQLVAWSAVFGNRWLAAPADGSGAFQRIDRLDAELWQEG